MVSMKSGFSWRAVLAVLVGVALVWTLAYWILAAVLSGSSECLQVWKPDVQFVFSGVERGEYPNGMPFLATDLIVPVVVERVLQTVAGLPSDVDHELIAQLLSVTAHFPGANELSGAFRRRLGDNLSLTEVRELEAAFSAEFARGSRSRTRISLTASRRDLPAPEILAALAPA